MKTPELLAAVKAAMARLGLSASQAAPYMNLAQSTLQGVLSAGRNAETAAVQQALREFLRQVERGDIRGASEAAVVPITAGKRGAKRKLGRERRIYATETMRKVARAIDIAVENSSLAVITAEYGHGKTEAVQHWRAGHPEIENVLLEFSVHTTSNIVNFTAQLAGLLGIQAHITSATLWAVTERIMAQLNEQPAVLIFDQCEGVSGRVLDDIRQIWDRTRGAGTAVVLLAAPVFHLRMQKMRSGSHLGAFRSRVGVWTEIPGVQREEMEAILKAEGILGQVDEAAFDSWYRALGGSMRYLMESIDLVLTVHKGRRISEQTVIQFSRNLMGLAIPARPAARRRAAEEKADGGTMAAGGGE